MTDKTQEFLDACKKAGYEKVTIFIRDSRVPLTSKSKIKDGPWFGMWGRIDGKPIELYKHKVVCGYPEQLGKSSVLPGDKWPKMWDIVKNLELTVGLQFGGFGLGDAHDIQPILTAGYYDLANA